jgi:hypothetical protein
MSMKRFSLSFDQIFAIVATVAVLWGIGAGFWVLGTPGRQRLISADRQRLQDLNQIAQELHWRAEAQDNYELPASLPDDDLQQDPLTGQPYEYIRLTETTYQLCAEFATDSSTYPLQNRQPNRDRAKWSHPQGRHCFEFDLTQQPSGVY